MNFTETPKTMFAAFAVLLFLGAILANVVGNRSTNQGIPELSDSKKIAVGTPIKLSKAQEAEIKAEEYKLVNDWKFQARMIERGLVPPGYAIISNGVFYGFVDPSGEHQTNFDSTSKQSVLKWAWASYTINLEEEAKKALKHAEWKVIAK